MIKNTRGDENETRFARLSPWFSACISRLFPASFLLNHFLMHLLSTGLSFNLSLINDYTSYHN